MELMLYTFFVRVALARFDAYIQIDVCVCYFFLTYESSSFKRVMQTKHFLPLQNSLKQTFLYLHLIVQWENVPFNILKGKTKNKKHIWRHECRMIGKPRTWVCD